MIEERKDIGYLMWMEISRPHAAPRHSHRVIGPSEYAYL
jgi:hypothetical protein